MRIVPVMQFNKVAAIQGEQNLLLFICEIKHVFIRHGLICFASFLNRQHIMPKLT